MHFLPLLNFAVQLFTVTNIPTAWTCLGVNHFKSWYYYNYRNAFPQLSSKLFIQPLYCMGIFYEISKCSCDSQFSVNIYGNEGAWSHMSSTCILTEWLLSVVMAHQNLHWWSQQNRFDPVVFRKHSYKVESMSLNMLERIEAPFEVDSYNKTFIAPAVSTGIWQHWSDLLSYHRPL